MSEWVWGIDPAIEHISCGFAALAHDTIEVESIIVSTPEREGARLAHIYRETHQWATQTCRVYPPADIWVEQASGRHHNPSLQSAVGAITAALCAATGAQAWSVPSGRWKKAALGFGNASKAQIREHVHDVLRIDTGSQDEADAVLIAHAGRAMFQARSWDAQVAA